MFEFQVAIQEFGTATQRSCAEEFAEGFQREDRLREQLVGS